MCRSPAECADVVDPDLVPDGLEHVEIRMRAPRDAGVIPKKLGCKEERDGALADAGRTVQQIGVRRALGERCGQQALRFVLLCDGRERHGSNGSTAAQISAAMSSTSRAAPSSPAVETTRQSSRSASSRYTSRVALLCTASGLPPVPEGVASMPSRRGQRGRG